MYNITLIGTNHSEQGKCNSDELYKIIEGINPDIIFEEISSTIFDLFYTAKCDIDGIREIHKFKLPRNLLDTINALPLSAIPLEVNCIRKYLRNFNIKNVPVDIEVNYELSSNLTLILTEFYKHDDVYKSLVDEAKLLTEKHGFEYLNSKTFFALNDKIKIRERELIESNWYNIAELLRLYDLSYKEIIDDRENAMLQNIYNYSKENVFKRAVFLIGARHRNTIVEKIIKYDIISEAKLIWRMYGSECL